jgi:hypothetical protein
VPLAIGGGQRGHHGERRRDRGDPQLAAQAVAQRVDLLAHGTAVADDTPSPVEHALALGREALEAGAAVHQQHAHLLFQLLHTGRQRRLGDAARLGGAAEMPLPRQRQNEIELVDHTESLFFSGAWRTKR